MTKICSKCKTDKIISEFHKSKKQKDGLRTECKQCRKQKYNQNKTTILEKQKNKYDKNKTYHKDYYIKNKEKIISYNKQYRLNNKDKISQYNQKYLHNNINLRLSGLLRSRIKLALNNKSKSKSTLSLLGCSIEKLKHHLQQTAINNGDLKFDINNYSGKEDHIEHIKPCSSFDLSKEEEQKKCFHYSNLQILTAEENLKKSDKY